MNFFRIPLNIFVCIVLYNVCPQISYLLCCFQFCIKKLHYSTIRSCVVFLRFLLVMRGYIFGIVLVNSSLISKQHQLTLFVSSTSNLFLFVLKVNAFPITIMFGMCSIFLFVACILQRRLMVISEKPSKQNISSRECFSMEFCFSYLLILVFHRSMTDIKLLSETEAYGLKERDHEAEPLNI